MILEKIEKRIRNSSAEAVTVLGKAFNHHQAIGIGKGERAQQQGVGDGENRGIGTDAERQRENGDQAERRVLQQKAHLHQRIQESE
jgi:hypothetical protein